MRILVGIATLKRGGAERVVSILSQEWIKTHEVTVAVFNNRDQAYPIGGNIVSLNSKASHTSIGKLFQFFRRVKWIKRLIITLAPDIIITFSETTNLPFINASEKLGVLSKLIISIHTPPKRVNRKFHYWMKKWYPRVKEIIVVGKKLQEDVSTFLEIEKKKIRHIPNPISLEVISKQLSSQSKVHPNPFILGMGRMTEEKGFDLLINAFSNIVEETPIDLLIVGDGHLKETIQKQVRDFGLQDRIFILPGTNEPFLYLSQCEVFILSSRYEGWGLVLTEAMACQRPVISFDCPVGPRQILENGEHGILVPENNTENLANEIIDLLNNIELQNKYIESGFKRVQEFDVKTIAPLWLSKHDIF